MLEFPRTCVEPVNDGVLKAALNWRAGSDTAWQAGRIESMWRLGRSVAAVQAPYIRSSLRGPLVSPVGGVGVPLGGRRL
jgi:hypothetical protein